MMSRKIWIFILFVAVFSACKNNNQPQNTTKSLSLLKYGIPFDIASPSDAVARKISTGTQHNVSINNGKDYDVQVLMTPAIVKNIEQIKAEKKAALLANPYFMKVVEEMDNGFIYEKRYDDSKAYDFFLVKIQGNHELSFECGSSGMYSEDQVKNMVKTVLNGF